MAIQQECPFCRRKQKTKNRKCVSCGQDLIKAKDAGKVIYYIKYYLPGKKQVTERIGNYIKDAQAADGKRKAQKCENPGALKKFHDGKITFQQLSDWYLGLETTKSKKYLPTLKINLSNFNEEFGNRIVASVKPFEIEDYQVKRKKAGYSDSYIDQEVKAAKATINKAFANNIVSGEALKIFQPIKNLLRKGSNKRKKILSNEEYSKILEQLPLHVKQIFATAYYTGMRKGEIVNLTWNHVHLEEGVICLEPEMTKDKEERTIPICPELSKMFSSIKRSEKSDYVFIWRDGKPTNDIRTSLKKACKAAGVTYGRFAKDGFIFHDMRRTFVVNITDAGVPQAVRMDITGHSTLEMDARYNVVDLKRKREAIERFEEHLKNSGEESE